MAARELAYGQTLRDSRKPAPQVSGERRRVDLLAFAYRGEV
jgi:hypothetical protein